MENTELATVVYSTACQSSWTTIVATEWKIKVALKLPWNRFVSNVFKFRSEHLDVKCIL